MKKLCFILSCCLWFMSFSAKAQNPLFHFIDTTTVIAVTTSQSPAHWYIEIYNDAGQDTLLRWITHFENIPANWTINFDDQHTNHPTIFDGDSSDLVLLQDVFNAQKLIIGAETAQTPGWGIVYFQIFNPYNRSESQNIEYHFHIGDLGLNEVPKGSYFLFEEGLLKAKNNAEMQLSFYTLDGKILLQKEAKGIFDPQEIPSGTDLIMIRSGENSMTWKPSFR